MQHKLHLVFHGVLASAQRRGTTPPGAFGQILCTRRSTGQCACIPPL